MHLFILLHGVLVVVLAVAMWGLSSQIRDGNSVSCIAGGFLTTGPPGKSQIPILLFLLFLTVWAIWDYFVCVKGFAF